MGFSRVYRYVAGKADWAASGLPTEGKQTTVLHADTLARRDVPTCQLTDRLSDVCARVRAAGYNECVVVNDKRIVLGHLGPSELDTDPDAAVETIMKSGPITIRPNTSGEAILRRMQKGKMDSLLVTTSDGELLGVLNRQDVEERKDHKRDEREMRSPTTYVEVGAR